MSENRPLTGMLRARARTFPEQSRKGSSRPSADDNWLGRTVRIDLNGVDDALLPVRGN
jgi:hypothetical protein